MDVPRVACWTVDAPKSDAKDDVVVAGVAVADFVRENPDAVVVVAVDSCPLPKEYAPVAAVGTAVLAKEKDGCVVGFAKLKLFAAGCEDGAPNVSPPEPAAAPELVVDVVVDVVTNGKPPAEKPPVGAG